ncbi:MAG: tetratricopeptide repeat protein [Bacteroidetes bacterium]|nr:tetratricopeptide repeat protein [Bacteroidota bacterium]
MKKVEKPSNQFVAKKTQRSSDFIDQVPRTPYVILTLAIAIIITYSRTLGFTLGKLDETNIILNNLGLLTDFRNLGRAFLSNPFFNKGGDFYRPLQNLSFMLDAHLSGQAGWGYYLSNMIIHFLCCILVFHLLTLMDNRKKTAFLLTLLFAIHPLFVQTVAWAPSRGDLLLALFSLLSVNTFILYLRQKKVLYLAINIISFGLALFSKETAIVIPLVCFLLFIIEKEKLISFKGLLIPAAGYLVLFALFMYLRNVVVEIQVQKGLFGAIPLLVHLRTIPDFIAKFFIPVALGPMPAFKLPLTVAGVLLMAAIIYMIVRNSSRNRLFLGLAWFLLFITPAIMYINKFGSASCDYMEHRAYLPLVGILLIVFLLINASPKLKDNRIFHSMLLVLIPIFGIYTFLYSGNYKTPMSYYNRAIENNPASAIALFNRAATRMDINKDYAGAIEDYDRSIYLLPDYAESYNNRGFCKESLKDTAAAVQDYTMATRLKPGWTGPHINLANLRLHMGQLEEAIHEYDTVLYYDPSNYTIYKERASARSESGDIQGAYEDISQAIKLKADYVEAYFQRGLLLEQMQEPQAALEDFDKAIQLKPDDPAAYTNRGILKYRLQDFNGSLDDFNQAIAIDPQFSDAYLNRGMSRYQLKDLEGACEDWNKANQLNSPDAPALLKNYCRH